MFICSKCSFTSPKWMGRCTSCGEWDSFVIKEEAKDLSRKRNSKKVVFKKLRDLKSNITNRVKTGFEELDRVLGGGFVNGEVVLLGGEPGIGKTTLLLKVLGKISTQKRCFYISSEESFEQLKIHSTRLNVNDELEIANEDDVDAILTFLSEQKAEVVVIDSIQTLFTSDLPSSAGSLAQVKECAKRVIDFSKKNSVTTILIGHITKDGEVAGPKMLEHMVDAVFYLEGERDGDIRLIRSVKNRFGSTREVGIFKVTNKGYVDAGSIPDIFVKSKKDAVGVCKSVVLDGNRAIVIEIQALVEKSIYASPLRVSTGISRSKLQMISAVISKYAKINLLDMDIYVNVAGGFKFANDSSIDLAIAVAIFSSIKNIQVKKGIVAIGEVSLSGEIFKPNQFEARIEALKRLGFSMLLVPKSDKNNDKNLIEIDKIKNLGMVL